MLAVAFATAPETERAMAAGKGASDGLIRNTSGDVFANGEALELVAQPSSENLQLLHWNGDRFQIGAKFRVGEATYQAPRLHASALKAIQFPSTAREYGDARELFGTIAGLIRQATGLDEAAAMVGALWVRSSWFADFSSNPPLLHLTGPEKPVVRLLRILQSLCRKSLMVSELTRFLPFYLQPTLIAYAPILSTKHQAWWRASNHVGVFVPESGGKFRNLACAKAVYAGDQEDSPDAWGPNALRVNLSQIQPLPDWSESEEKQLAALYQPRLLMFRLQNFPRVQQAMSAPRGTAVNSELARNLLASGPDAPEIVNAVTPWLVAYEDELSARRSTDANAILIEGLWTPSHESPQMPVSDLTKRVNATLRSRRERDFYSEKEVGWKLRQLRIPRSRNGRGMVVRFSSEVRRRVHALARQFGLNLPPNENCPDCQESQADVAEQHV
jgi:hypothetical protein